MWSPIRRAFSGPIPLDKKWAEAMRKHLQVITGMQERYDGKVFFRKRSLGLITRFLFEQNGLAYKSLIRPTTCRRAVHLGTGRLSGWDAGLFLLLAKISRAGPRLLTRMVSRIIAGSSMLLTISRWHSLCLRPAFPSNFETFGSK